MGAEDPAWDEEEQAEIDQLHEIFRAHLAKYHSVFNSQTDSFIHYSSAEAAINIVGSGCMWLRNATTMNDSMEIRHGTTLVRQYFTGSRARPLFDCLNRIDPNFESSLKDLYDAWIDDIEQNTFVGCLTHHRQSLNPHGQLSMWRAYGGDTGVALVLDPSFLEFDTDHLGVHTHPVLYLDGVQAFALFDEFVKQIVFHEPTLKTKAASSLLPWALEALQNFGLTLKHPAFREEVEWRLIHRPLADPSHLVPSRVVTVGGIPQLVHCLPLEEEKSGIDIGRLLRQILIGPCDHPEVIANAICEKMDQSGIMSAAEARGLVTITNIPLRRSRR